MKGVPQQIDSHNSMMTNKEMAILSSQIDMVALQALQSLRYDAVNAYFNSAEHYYKKMAPIITDEKDVKAIEKLITQYNKVRTLIEDNPKCRTRKAIRLMLNITKDFYFLVRQSLQQNGKYYFRTSRVNNKGLNSVKFDDHKGASDED